MNIASIFIKRPVMTTLVMMAILLFGIMAYRQLPVSDLPNVDFPTIQVSAGLPGASPETMASAVATPLERQFSTIAGLDTMTSASSLGSTNITLQFVLSRDLDAAAQDVQAAIAAAARQLPPNMPAPPSYNKVNPADTPVIYLALASDTMPMNDLDEYAETLMAQRISTVEGVAQVQVYGSQKYAVPIFAAQLPKGPSDPGGRFATAVSMAARRPLGGVKGDHGKRPSAQFVAAFSPKLRSAAESSFVTRSRS